ncbi:MAG TPA: type II toxin-antitoxin system VapC family toxin [Gammaproteobacteria bacterium]
MGYLIDTNVVIYYFNGLIRDDSFHDLLASSFNVSIITKIEFLSWDKFYSNQHLYNKANAFMGNANVLGLSDLVAEKAIGLRQQYKTKTPDAIIAATALVHGLSIVTNNIDDFKCFGLDISTVSV